MKKKVPYLVIKTLGRTKDKKGHILSIKFGRSKAFVTPCYPCEFSEVALIPDR